MSYLGDILLGTTFDCKFTTVSGTGLPTILTGTPAVSAYEDNGTTEITAGVTLTANFDSVAGLNNVRVVATTANGFEAGKNYQLVITAGTVDSVSVIGYVVGQFSIEARSILGYIQLALRGDAAIATDRASILTAINADLGSGAGAYDNTKILELTDAGAAAFIKSTTALVVGTVDDSALTPTATTFECSDITDATADTWTGVGGIFAYNTTTAALRNIRFKITGYSKVGSNGRFVVTMRNGSALPAAPVDGDVIVLT